MRTWLWGASSLCRRLSSGISVARSWQSPSHQMGDNWHQHQMTKTIKLWDAGTGGTLLQMPKVDVVVYCIAFCIDGSCSETHSGMLPISSGSILFRSSLPSALFVKGRWVAHEMENQLWLPFEYRPICIALHNDIIIFGYDSGSLSIFEFTFWVSRASFQPTSSAHDPHFILLIRAAHLHLKA